MKLLIILTTFLLLSSCGSRTKYKPSIYGHDYKTQEIVTPVTYERISCGDKDFNKYVSVSLEDLTSLALILKYAKLPYKVRLIVEGFRKEVRRKKALNKELLIE